MIVSEKVYIPSTPSRSPVPDPVAAGGDLALLEAARAMDREALGRIFDLYARPVYRYALRLCGDPLLADHIVGDVFTKLLDQLSAGRGPRTNLRSYLYEITYHLVVDEMRYAGARIALDALDMYRYEETVPPHLEDRLAFEKVMTAIRTVLTDDQRHVIILRFLEDMSLKETAAIIGKQVGHVKVIQSRALQALRKALRPEPGQE